jgi:pyrimidine operon attenuation protein/uracil phosphoribosyltransferase
MSLLWKVYFRIFDALMYMERKFILTAEVAARKIRRLAYEIAERNVGVDRLLLAGIHDNGYLLAQLLAAEVQQVSGVQVELVGIRLDKRRPVTVTLDRAVAVNDRVVIVVDDVASSGKTMLYALKPFLEAHPRAIQTLALVERTHKLFPVQPDYVGLSVATTLEEHIRVQMEPGRVVGAWLE